MALVLKPALVPNTDLMRNIKTWRNAHTYNALARCGLAAVRFSPRQWDKLASFVMWASGALERPSVFNPGFVVDKLLEAAGFRVRVDPALVRGSPAQEIAWESFVRNHDYQLTSLVPAAIFIQRRWRQWSGRRHAAARRIQRACLPWILKPVTADGKPGINVRILCRCL